MQDLYSDARQYISSTFGGVDMSSLSADVVRSTIEKVYEGGWSAYRADFERFMQSARETVQHLTPLQKFAKMRAKVGGSTQVFRLKLHEEVVSVEISDSLCVATVRTCKVETRRSRDRLTEIGLKRITYKKVDYTAGTQTFRVWSKPEIEQVSVPTSDDYLTWGRAWTAARVAEDTWQSENCYRPGTDTAPMDGPVRKLEISHEEAFQHETFQNPTTPPRKGARTS